MSDVSVGLCPMPSASENFVPVSNVQMLSASKGFSPRPPVTLHHHHRLTSFFHAAAQVRRFPRMSLLHTSRSCVSITLSFKFAMSVSTHSRHVFLSLPRPLLFTLSTTICLHADTQSSSYFRSTCPNHLHLSRLTTLETLCPADSTVPDLLS